MAEHSDDLDQLLDSALDDFQSLSLTTSAQRSGDNKGKGQENTPLPTGMEGLGMGLPDLRSKKKGKQKVSKESHASEALGKLREQTREAVKGLESAIGPKPGLENLENEAMMEDWVKQFEELAGSQRSHDWWVSYLSKNALVLEEILPWIAKDVGSIVETMMQQLLSKEILHEPMKEIGERYPKWLEENKAKLSSEEYERFSHQYQLVKDLNEVYETEPGNFSKIVELMQKMQECGQPPNDIVQELAPDFDLSNLGQLSPEMLESQQNCCIM